MTDLYSPWQSLTALDSTGQSLTVLGSLQQSLIVLDSPLLPFLEDRDCKPFSACLIFYTWKIRKLNEWKCYFELFFLEIDKDCLSIESETEQQKFFEWKYISTESKMFCNIQFMRLWFWLSRLLVSDWLTSLGIWVHFLSSQNPSCYLGYLCYGLGSTPKKDQLIVRVRKDKMNSKRLRLDVKMYECCIVSCNVVYHQQPTPGPDQWCGKSGQIATQGEVPALPLEEAQLQKSN